MLLVILSAQIKGMHLLLGFGPSWWSGGLDASGRPMAEAVAIFVLLLSWISFLGSSSLPLLFDRASLLCRMTSSRSGIDKHQRTSDACHQRYVPVGPCIWRRCKHGAKKKKGESSPVTPLIHCSPLFVKRWFIRPIQNYTHTHPHHPTLRRVYPEAPCCASSVWWCVWTALFIPKSKSFFFFQTDFILFLHLSKLLH